MNSKSYVVEALKTCRFNIIGPKSLWTNTFDKAIRLAELEHKAVELLREFNLGDARVRDLLSDYDKARESP